MTNWFLKAFECPLIHKLENPLVWVVLGSKIISAGFIQMLINMGICALLKNGCLEKISSWAEAKNSQVISISRKYMLCVCVVCV